MDTHTKENGMDLNIIDTSDWIDTSADPFEIGQVLKITRTDGTVETRAIVGIEFADPSGLYYPEPTIFVLTFSDGSQLYYDCQTLEEDDEILDTLYTCPLRAEDPYHYEIM